MAPLSSNTELYEYLVSFANDLERRGLRGLSETVATACHKALMPTEFLGESRIALRRVLVEENGALTGQERSDVRQVRKQLDEALGPSPG
jgi:hypothetical protein